MSEVCALGGILVKMLFSSLLLYTFHHVVRKIMVWRQMLNMFSPIIGSWFKSQPKRSYPVLIAS